MPWQGSACSGLGIFLGCQVAGAGRNADGFPRQLMFLFSFYFFLAFYIFFGSYFRCFADTNSFFGRAAPGRDLPGAGGIQEGQLIIN